MMLPFKICLLICVLTMLVCEAGADTLIVQIGGGDRIDNSQGQIEDNVIWLNRILKKTGMPLKNFFASGDSNEKDVALYVDRQTDRPMQAISRVFGAPADERIHYRHNQVPDLSGSMYKEEITKGLGEIISGLTKGQDLLVIYNGHGGMDDDDVRKNYLKIWGNDKLTVEEIDALFDKAPQDSTIRFVFPQCFSGGFFHLIYDDPYSKEYSRQQRCGFLAESPYDESEGCSLSTNRQEYRDYTTYYFAPLNGKARTGEELPLSADFNEDSIVTYSEAHKYTILAGVSKDLSRSTSESLLENWVPWYLRWGVGRYDKQSQYWTIAEYLSERDDLQLDVKQLNRERSDLVREINALRDKAKSCNKEAEILAKSIRKESVKYWPELINPYTTAYKAVIENQVENITRFILSNNQYQELVTMQDSCEQHEKNILATERRITQLEKVMRYMNLAKIFYYFDRFAGQRDKSQYASLVQCEDSAFFEMK